MFLITYVDSIRSLYNRCTATHSKNPSEQQPQPQPQPQPQEEIKPMSDILSRRHMANRARLPPEVNRILYVRNLPFKITAEELYEIFGKYGAVYQIRLGEKGRDTRGTAFVVYEDIYDAKSAVDHLSGFNVGGRYLVVLYYQPAKFQRRIEAEEKKKELEELRRQVKAKKAAMSAAENAAAS